MKSVNLKDVLYLVKGFGIYLQNCWKCIRFRPFWDDSSNYPGAQSGNEHEQHIDEFQSLQRTGDMLQLVQNIDTKITT